MKKGIITISLFVLFFGFLQAKPILVDNAKQVALSFVAKKQQNTNYLLTSVPTFDNLNVAYQKIETINGSDVASLYVFNNANGFVIVAGDDDVIPILGYSETSTFDANNIPPNVQWWLDSYSREIKYVVENNIKATTEVQRQWNNYQSVSQSGYSPLVSPLLGVAPLLDAPPMGDASPLIATMWDQEPYYNALAPAGCPTGCVATAMAQIMKFWNWPVRGKGQKTYTVATYSSSNQNGSKTYGGTTLSANFQNQSYQWDAMPLSISSANPAIATLMYHCGVSVSMIYDTDANGGSGAFETDIPTSLKNYFYYASTAQCSSKPTNTTSLNTWIANLQAELDAGRPVGYAGQGNYGGHSFVCDGYNSSGQFHFNWGWGGMDNGYFVLTGLNPGGYPFNSGQQAVMGIKPDNSAQITDLQMNSNITVTPSAIAVNQPFTISAEIANTGTVAYSGQIALALFNSSNTFVQWVGTPQTASMALSETKTVNFNCTGIAQVANYYLRLYFTNSSYTTGSTLVISSSTANNNTNLVGDKCISVTQNIPNNLQISVLSSICLDPVVTLNSYTATTATISWTGGTSSNYKIEWGTSGFAPGTGAAIGNTTVSASPYTITGLNSNTNYDAYVMSNCGSDGLSNWMKVSFTTDCQTYASSLNHVMCDGDSWKYGGVTYTTAGSYPIIFQARNGCDSIVTLNVTVNPKKYYSYSKTICEGDRVFFKGGYLTETGTYIDTLTVISTGCDSVVTLTLTVVPVNTSVTQTNNILTASQAGAEYQWLDCNNGNSPITGATAQSFSPTISGNYAVKVAYNGCNFVSVCTDIRMDVGVENVNDDNITVYPNPAKEVLYIDFKDISSGSTATITDILGRTIDTFNIDANNNVFEINVSSYSEGTYILRIASDKSNFVKRFIIKH